MLEQNNNPIFVEYYSHEKCDCYKIFNPWTKYHSDKLVLCRVDEGLDLAKERAKKELVNHLYAALNEPLKENPCIDCDPNNGASCSHCSR